MSDHLIEIIFKEIHKEKIGPLVIDLISKGKEIESYNITLDFFNIDWNIETINKIFFENKHFGLFINLKNLKSEEINLPNCGIAIYKYEKTIDLEINFQLSDLKGVPLKNLVKNLMRFSKAIADQYQIEQYLCGIEPAHDLQTRLFTKEEPGPFSFKD